MAFDSLGQFVQALRRAGELTEIRARVSAHLEISEITDRVVKAGGPALLFTDVAGSPYPVLTNQFGTEKRMALAFGAKSLDEVARRVRNAVRPNVPATMDGKIAKLFSVGSAAFAIPRTVTDAPVHDVVEMGDDVDLEKLPVLTTWPLDGGPFVTLPLVFTKDPETGQQNVGMYRMQRYDKTLDGHALAAPQTGPRARGEVGAHAFRSPSSSAPIPPSPIRPPRRCRRSSTKSRSPGSYAVARSIWCAARRSISKCPANAEFVLEGYVDNDDLRVEGPFGDHTGVYSLADYYPTFHVQCVTHRRAPIYAATVVGKPPMEDAWLGKATERLFLPLLQMVVPEIVDYNLPVEGGFHNLCIVSIKKSYPGHAKKVMNALWGLGHMMMLTRCLIVVDDDVDVHDTRAVTWFALNNVDPSRDLVVMPGPVDDLDHSGSYLVAVGHKLGIDATRKRADEGYARAWPPDIVMDAETTRATVTRRWDEYGLRRVAGRPDAWSGQGAAALERLLAVASARPRDDGCGRPARERSTVPALERRKPPIVSVRRVTAPRAVLAIVLKEIRVEHTLFALPFAYVGAVLAARGLPTAYQFVWITLAVLGARTAAMAANRYIDRDIDAANPRTARRALASGTIAPGVMLGVGIAGIVLLVVAAAALSPLCLRLLPLAALGIFAYPFCKRFTWGVHFVLGAVDGFAPLGAYIAVAGSVSWAADRRRSSR